MIMKILDKNILAVIKIQIIVLLLNLAKVLLSFTYMKSYAPSWFLLSMYFLSFLISFLIIYLLFKKRILGKRLFLVFYFLGLPGIFMAFSRFLENISIENNETRIVLLIASLVLESWCAYLLLAKPVKQEFKK